MLFYFEFYNLLLQVYIYFKKLRYILKKLIIKNLKYLAGTVMKLLLFYINKNHFFILIKIDKNANKEQHLHFKNL